MPVISMIVPARNEPDLHSSAQALAQSSGADEVLVIDTSPTAADVPPNAAYAYLHRPSLCTRARALNEGARISRGNILWFVHLDCRPPLLARQWIERHPFGAFCKTYDPASWILSLQACALNAFARACGFPVVGTNAIFVDRAIFNDVGGYPDWPLLEDLDLVRRLRSRERCRVSRDKTVVSSRNYANGEILRTMAGNLRVLAGYLLGQDPKRLSALYRKGKRR